MPSGTSTKMTSVSPTSPNQPTTRPTSNPTRNSFFADSAVDIETPTPSPKRERTESASSQPSFIFDRLTYLASLAWAIEQEGHLSGRTRLLTQLDNLEKSLEDDELADEGVTEPESGKTEVTNSDLQEVLSHLTTTVGSLRQRHQEQQHLHELSISRLEGIAQRCLRQEQEIRDLNSQIQSLRSDNKMLRGMNEGLCSRLNGLEQQMTQKDVAVDAMAGAVAGLEGWIDNVRQSPSPQRNSPSRSLERKPVMRGKGRFRGRYLDGASDVSDVQEGVKAWLRGFRDVEEGLKVVKSEPSAKANEVYTRSIHDDDFGEFETVV